MSEPTVAQPLKQIVATPRAARCRVQHLAVDCIVSLQLLQPLGSATSALARTAEVENEQGNGERNEGKTRDPPRPRPGQEPDQQPAPHHRRPLRQSSTRAQTATAMPPSATAMNSQRRLSRYGTSGRTALWVSASTSCATSIPAAPTVAAPAAPVPRSVRLSASTSRAGGVSAANGGRPDREALTPLTRGAKIDMHEVRAGIEAEAEEPDLARGGLERHRVVVGHRDIKGRALHVLGVRRPVHGLVMLGAAIAAGHDQRLAQPVAQRLQGIERGLMDQQLTGAAAGDLGRREVGQRQSPAGTSLWWS